MTRSASTRLRVSCTFALAASVLPTLVFARNWPLVGDASIMHYIVFLMRQGMVPYKDIVDINLPGTYFFEALGMHIFGTGALGWRGYDLFLLAMVLAASVALARRSRHWFAGVLASGLFALIHLQDGIFQVGQRDLLMAVLVLWACLALFEAQTGGQTGTRPFTMLTIFGLLLGTASTIKPVLMPLGLVLLGMAVIQLNKQNISSGKAALAGCIGAMLPLALAALWLLRIHALPSFLAMAKGLLVLHSSLGRRPVGYLLVHSIAPLGIVALPWLILVVVERAPMTPLRSQLYVGIFGTVFAYVAQGKGYPYQRYPVLALLLLAIGIDLDRMLDGVTSLRYAAATLCLALCLIVAPLYCWNATHFSPQTPFQDALGQKLDRLAATQDLSGSVQCLDTFGGCVGVLYQYKIVQSTGFLYDCYLFSPPSSTREAYRSAFLAQFLAKPPALVIETNQFCFSAAGANGDGFAKLAQWPELDQVLHQKYEAEPIWRSSVPQHWWSRKEEPVQFRLYKRRGGLGL